MCVCVCVCVYLCVSVSVCSDKGYDGMTFYRSDFVIQCGGEARAECIHAYTHTGERGRVRERVRKARSEKITRSPCLLPLLGHSIL